jgi:hypothetical protein
MPAMTHTLPTPLAFYRALVQRPDVRAVLARLAKR